MGVGRESVFPMENCITEMFGFIVERDTASRNA